MASAPSPWLAGTAGCRGRGCRRQRSRAASPLLSMWSNEEKGINGKFIPLYMHVADTINLLPQWQYHISTVEGLSAIASLSFSV